MASSEETKVVIIYEQTYPMSYLEEAVNPQDGEMIKETFQQFFFALSEYIKFLNDWSGCCLENMDPLDDNYRNPFNDSATDILDYTRSSAQPVVRFKEAAESLKICCSHYQINDAKILENYQRGFWTHPQMQNLDNIVDVLFKLSCMVFRQYESATLNMLDEKITLLQVAPLFIHRDFTCFVLGMAFFERYKFTNELNDLDCAISNLNRTLLAGIGDKYEVFLELLKCFLDRYNIIKDVADYETGIGLGHEALSDIPFTHNYHHLILQALGHLTLMHYNFNKVACAITLRNAISYYWDSLEVISGTEQYTILPVISILTNLLIRGYIHAGLIIKAEDIIKLLQIFLLNEHYVDSEMGSSLSHKLVKLILIVSKDYEYSDEMMSVVRKFISLLIDPDIHHFANICFWHILISQFIKFEKPDNRDEVIAACQAAIQYAPDAKVRAETLVYLAKVLLIRYKMCEDMKIKNL
ncbi:hypothetical protein BDQ17DRAFT_1425645 [Cyathus striatus]|nr:hypothetical protein BDQ17DRAFT_1425645 [Cyathus striatus]